MGSGLVRDSNEDFVIGFVVKFSHHDVIQSARQWCTIFCYVKIEESLRQRSKLTQRWHST